jgi:hypothetical protein
MPIGAGVLVGAGIGVLVGAGVLLDSVVGGNVLVGNGIGIGMLVAVGIGGAVVMGGVGMLAVGGIGVDVGASKVRVLEALGAGVNVGVGVKVNTPTIIGAMVFALGGDDGGACVIDTRGRVILGLTATKALQRKRITPAKMTNSTPLTQGLWTS